MPCPPPGDLPNPGIEPRSLTLQADSLLSEPPGKPTYGKANIGPALEVNDILILSSVSLCIAGVLLMASRHEYRTIPRWDVSELFDSLSCLFSDSAKFIEALATENKLSSFQKSKTWNIY